jgi:hypothetical protein
MEIALSVDSINKQHDTLSSNYRGYYRLTDRDSCSINDVGVKLVFLVLFSPVEEPRTAR